MKPGGRRFLLVLYDAGYESIPPASAPLYSSSSSSSSSSKSMTVTALIILLCLFFFGFFGVYARRAISRLRRRSSSSAAFGRPHGRSLFPPPAHGLDHLAVGALPVLRYVGGGGGGGKEDDAGAAAAGGGCCCVVCLSEFEEKERVKVIPRCGHAFHPACIDAWLVTRGSCPVCRCADVFGSCSGSGFLGQAAAATAAAAEQEVEEGEEAAEKVGMRRSDSCSRGGADEGPAMDKVELPV